MIALRCLVVRPSGVRCINPVQEGRSTCAAHDPRRWCGAPLKGGATCRRMKVQGQDACSYHVVES